MGSSDATDSSDESEEVIKNGDISESSSTENTKSKASEGVTNGSETDSEDEGAVIEKDDAVVITNGNSVSDDAEDPELLQPKKVSNIIVNTSPPPLYITMLLHKTYSNVNLLLVLPRIMTEL